MQKMIQIIYISRSTFAPAESFKGIEPNVARILAKSRVNNRKNGLVGVLYFGDGCFFQCLEGEESAIHLLYAKLQSDVRHKDVKLLSRKTITKLSFPDWSMKYVPLDTQMNRLLESHGMQAFDPYHFSKELIASVMKLLHSATDSTEQDSHEHKAGQLQKVAVVAKHPNSLAKLALGLSALSFIVSVSAFAIAFK